MRIIPFAISTVVTAGLVFAFNRPLGPLPMPAGKFLSPQHGLWQNAEPSSTSFDADLSFPDLKGKAEVYFACPAGGLVGLSPFNVQVPADGMSDFAMLVTAKSQKTGQDLLVAVNR